MLVQMLVIQIYKTYIIWTYGEWKLNSSLINTLAGNGPALPEGEPVRDLAGILGASAPVSVSASSK